MFLFHDDIKFIKNTKCKLYYNSLLVKKRQLSPYQSILSREFDIHNSFIWCKINLNKIIYFSDPIIAEFDYKLLHNILNNNHLVRKCKVRFEMHCRYCTSEIENTKHLIYECCNVKNIWLIIGNILGFIIQWKHVVVVFFLENNEKLHLFNNMISCVACRIYKYKM